MPIGDDAALLRTPFPVSPRGTAPTADRPDHGALVSSVHTAVGALANDPSRCAETLVADGVRDLRGRHVKARWLTLALTLPAPDDVWLGAFADRLASVCRRQELVLVGGDTTRGPHCVTVFLHGYRYPPTGA